MTIYRVLGIDPGTNIVGYGIVEGDESQSLYVHSGIVQFKASRDITERTHDAFRTAKMLIEKHQPDAVATEGGFVFAKRGGIDAIALGYGRGAIFCAAGEMGYKVSIYAPTTIKKAITGKGNSTKEEVRDAVVRLAGKTMTQRGLKWKPDETDGVAIAYTHFYVQYPRALITAPEVKNGPR